jgi:DNA-binding CsgD family transcriptional regulator
MTTGGIVLERHRGRDRLLGWASTYATAINDPCTKALEHDKEAAKTSLATASSILQLAIERRSGPRRQTTFAAEKEVPMRIVIVTTDGLITQGGAESARCEVQSFPEDRVSGRDARSGCGRSAQSSCLVSKTLTARERDILAMIGQGLTNKRIGRGCEISPEAVKTHIKRIFSKLAVSTRAQAVSQAVSLGLLRGGSPW